MPEKSKQANGAKPRRRRKPASPKLPKKTKKLTLKAFGLAYEAHHSKIVMAISTFITAVIIAYFITQ